MNRLDFLKVLIGSSVKLLSPNFITPKSQLERKSINRPQYQMELYHYRLQINVLK